MIQIVVFNFPHDKVERHALRYPIRRRLLALSHIKMEMSILGVESGAYCETNKHTNRRDHRMAIWYCRITECRSNREGDLAGSRGHYDLDYAHRSWQAPVVPPTAILRVVL